MINEKDLEKEKEKILIEVKDKIEKERTMGLSIKEGSAASVMSGLGDSYISPFAIALKANNLQIGLLSSFAGLMAPIAQVFGSRLMENHSRKSIIVKAVTLHALMWFPIMFLSIFFIKGIFVSYLPIILIIFYSMYAFFGSLAGPAWFSLLGDIVPEHRRGRYFGLRSRICGTVALISMLAGAFVLDFYKTQGYVLLAFSVFFLIAGIARLVSANMFRKHYYPDLKLEKGYYFSFWQFLKKAPHNNFGKFVIYIALIYFGVQIAGPFFTVYMLKDLSFSYLTFTIINASASVFTLLTLSLWGRFSDKYGNRLTLKIGSILISIMPLLWIFSKSPIYLIFVPQLVSGIGWASFNLASSNFIYDSVTPQRRGLCVAYFNLTVGIAMFLGSLVGGILAQNLTISFMNKILFIFFLSAVLRFVIIYLVLPLVKEVRKVKVLKNDYFIHLRDLRPLRDVFNEIHIVIKKIRGKKVKVEV